MSTIQDRLNAALRGRYLIEGELGEGGMATVYLARDERHNRKVALKVLKPELAAVVGADRFLAEIETTANLQHPHILPLFDSGEADGFLFYVMPYIEGETLRERIDRDKQLPVDEALGIATAVANALQVAHDAGIVHRDIKPGNILLSRGEPLVADFGIAIAVGTAGGSRLTETGLSVGTPFYMSPEQATGDQVVGAASDTSALACVLYEMLVGEPPYLGNTAQAVLGKIIQGTPVSATAARKSIPANVDAAIRKGLERLPADRFKSAHDFAKALADPAFRHGEERTAETVAPRRTRVLAFAGWGVAAALAGILAWGATRPAPVEMVKRFSMPFEEGEEMTFMGEAGFAMSPDGSTLVYRSGNRADQVLMARRWDDLAASPIRETEGGFFPSLSPDATSLAFTTPGGEVHVLDLAGGPVRNLGEGQAPVWGYDGHVYFNAGPELVRVSGQGGAREVLLTLQEGESGQRVTDVLPGDTHLIRGVAVEGGIQLRILNLKTMEERPLTFGLEGEVSPTGHLLYVTDGALMAAPLDVKGMELTGPGVPVEDGVLSFSMTDEGSLLYTTGAGGGTNEVQPVWLDREGNLTVVDPSWTFDRTANPNDQPAISPDGTRIAVREFTEDGFDIWVKQLPTGPLTRLTRAEAEDRMATWHPNGRDILFISSRDGDRKVWSRRADGTGEPSLLIDFDMPVAEMSWAPDGRFLVLRTAGTGGIEGGRDLYLWDSESDEPPRRLLAQEVDEASPAVSPDGRWLAYTSNESNRYELYVRPFPDVEDGRWQISVEGGRSPLWSPDGSELFFFDADLDLMVVRIEPGPTFQASPPQPL
ncbi:MAG: protein kinase, partial [Longimicrobiales bacterium]|nr:protein kinase [Longimicrobiales bacterium]